jgi:hypothetical protein
MSFVHRTAAQCRNVLRGDIIGASQKVNCSVLIKQKHLMEAPNDRRNQSKQEQLIGKK